VPDCHPLAGFRRSPKPASGGLAFDDKNLLNELANRGMETMLQRAFELNKIPPTSGMG